MALRNRWLALTFFAGMAILHSWPLASDITHLSRTDNHDAETLIWTIAWDAHAIATDPLQLFEAPVFYPERHSLAFSEHLLVQGVMGAPLLWSGISPVTVYNVLIIVGLALSGFAMFVLMERWTGSQWAALIAGLLYAFNAHVLTRFVHLQAQHVEFFPIMLLAFDRVIVNGKRRDVWLLAGMFVLQALCSNYLLVFSTYALLASAMVRWRELNLAVIRRLALAGTISVLALLPFLLPYYLVDRDKGLSRSADVVTSYNAGWRAYLATGARLHFDWWSRAFYDGRAAFFPGVTAIALAIAGLVTNWRQPRVRTAMAIAILGIALSFGTSLPGYRVLHGSLPLLSGLRNVGRWGWLFLAGLSILAGYGAAALEKRSGRRWTVLALVLGVLVTAESLRTPVGYTSFSGISPIYDQLAHAQDVVVAEFPFYSGADIPLNGPYMLANTRYFKPMVNGYSSLQPESFEQRGRTLRTFPGNDALTELKKLGVTHVFVHTARFGDAYGEQSLQAIDTITDLQLVADQDGIRLYRLR